jgi:hypothetical protein
MGYGWDPVFWPRVEDGPPAGASGNEEPGLPIVRPENRRERHGAARHALTALASKARRKRDPPHRRALTEALGFWRTLPPTFPPRER